jgi:hypothetical protein
LSAEARELDARKQEAEQGMKGLEYRLAQSRQEVTKLTGESAERGQQLEMAMGWFDQEHESKALASIHDTEGAVWNTGRIDIDATEANELLSLASKVEGLKLRVQQLELMDGQLQREERVLRTKSDISGLEQKMHRTDIENAIYAGNNMSSSMGNGIPLARERRLEDIAQARMEIEAGIKEDSMMINRFQRELNEITQQEPGEGHPHVDAKTLLLNAYPELDYYYAQGERVLAEMEQELKKPGGIRDLTREYVEKVSALDEAVDKYGVETEEYIKTVKNIEEVTGNNYKSEAFPLLMEKAMTPGANLPTATEIIWAMAARNYKMN